MKKLKLSISGLKGAEILTREQLKSVIGGDGSGGAGDSCSVTCGTGYYACCVAAYTTYGPPIVKHDATCTCVTNGTSSTCGSGGAGSTQCSVS